MSTPIQDLRRVGYPLSRELVVRRCTQAATPPAGAGELARMARAMCEAAAGS